MQSSGANTPPENTLVHEDPDLPSGHDLFILKEMCNEFEAENFAFQGIKRKLGLHQETLSRALHRLERDGFIEKTGNSYKISGKGQAIIVSGKDLMTSTDRHSLSYQVPILTAVLPPDLNPQEFLKALEHKWFGNLRWYGSSEGEDHVSLTWITQDGSNKLTAIIANGSLTIEVETLKGNQMPLSVRDAYQLFDHIMKTLREVDFPTSRGKMGSAS